MRILVPLDGSTFSEAILGPIIQMAEAADVDVHLVTVVEQPRMKSNWVEALAWVDEGTGEFGMGRVPLPQASEPSGSDVASETAEQAMERALQAAGEYLAQVAGRFPSGRAKPKAIPGEDSVEEIMAFCREEGVELIAMSTHGRSGLGRWVYGSTANKLLNATPIPLLLLRPRDDAGGSLEQRRIETLVVPLDGSELAESSLPYAEELALQMGLNVSLIRVTPTPNLGFPGMEPYAYDGQMYVDMERAAEGYLRQKQTELEQRGLSVESTLKGGHPAAHIIDHAEAIEGSLIVMSTHGRSGVGRWVMGSVADRILRASASPILLIRSQGAAT